MIRRQSSAVLKSTESSIITYMGWLLLNPAYCCCIFFFFQAEDGIRDYKVTGVQTCALPICPKTCEALNAGEGCCVTAHTRAPAGCADRLRRYRLFTSSNSVAKGRRLPPTV